jgi:uncharacterized membrane protein
VAKTINKHSQPKSRDADRAALILLLILGAAAALRLPNVGSDPPSLDELWSLELSTGRGSIQLDLPVNHVIPAPAMTELDGAPPWPRVWTSLGRVTHPPLYFLILRGWRALLGPHEAAARSLSIVASLAAIVLFYDAVRVLCRSRTVALWSAALMAVATPQVQHAQLVRSYAILLCFGTLAWWCVARSSNSTGRAKYGFGGLLCVATFAMLLTHYFAVGAVVALFAYAVIALKPATRRVAAGAVVVGVVAWGVVWGPSLVAHARHFSGDDSTTRFLHRDASETSRILQTLSDVGAVPLRLLVHTPQRSIPWGWLPGIATLALMFQATRVRRRELLLPILWFIGIVGVLLVLDLARSTRHLQAVRYALLASPGLYVLIAGALAHTELRHVLPALLIVACVVDVLALPAAPEPDWRPLAEFLDAPERGNDVIAFNRHGISDWFVGFQVMAYRHASRQPPGRSIVVVDYPSQTSLAEELKGRPRIWLINESPVPFELNAMLPGWAYRPANSPGFPAALFELRPAK